MIAVVDVNAMEFNQLGTKERQWNYTKDEENELEGLLGDAGARTGAVVQFPVLVEQCH